MATERLPYLDGWRGLAILMVLIGHFGPDIQMDTGRFGVDLFFVLSGLLMSRILFEQRMPIGKFYRRRISRIIPVLWLYIAVVVPVSDVIGHTVSLEHVIGLLTFTRTYMTPGIWWGHGAPIAHTWSLNVEEHSYLIMSIVAAIPFLRKRSFQTLAALGIATFFAGAAYSLFDRSVPYYMLRTECAATGIFLSASYRTIAPRIHVPKLLPIIAVLLAYSMYSSALKGEFKWILGPFLLAFAVNHINESPRWILKFFEFKPLCLLGILSYSIYLWQQPFFYMQHRMFPGAALAVAILVGAVSYYLFESPVRKWLNEKWQEVVAIPQPVPDPE